MGYVLKIGFSRIEIEPANVVRKVAWPLEIRNDAMLGNMTTFGELTLSLRLTNKDLIVQGTEWGSKRKCNVLSHERVKNVY